MIRSADQYSRVAKRLQILAIIIAGAFLLFGTTRAFSHVELHADIEAQRRKIEKEKAERRKAEMERRVIKGKDGNERIIY